MSSHLSCQHFLERFFEHARMRACRVGAVNKLSRSQWMDVCRCELYGSTDVNLQASPIPCFKGKQAAADKNGCTHRHRHRREKKEETLPSTDRLRPTGAYGHQHCKQNRWLIQATRTLQPCSGSTHNELALFLPCHSQRWLGRIATHGTVPRRRGGYKSSPRGSVSITQYRD